MIEVDINQSKANNIIDRIQKRIQEYNPLDSSESFDKEIQEDIKKAQELLDDVRNYLEVYDFLNEGPKGKDPE